MFPTLKKFVVSFFLRPLGWRMWAGILIIVNAAIPLFFLDHLEAQLILFTFFGTSVMGLLIFNAQGFTRLLGIMHFPWFFLLVYLGGVLGQTTINSFFGVWIRSLILINGASLVLDIFDVFRYLFLGERESIIGL